MFNRCGTGEPRQKNVPDGYHPIFLTRIRKSGDFAGKTDVFDN
jgi:hypothetical protein